MKSAYLRMLNRKHPQLQESIHLLLVEPQGLPLLQQLQQQRVLAAYRNLRRHWMPFQRTVARSGWLVLLLLTIVAVGIGVSAWRNKPLASTAEPVIVPSLPVRAVRLVVTPPRYTGQQPVELPGLDGEVPAGSWLRWTVPAGAEVPTRLVLGAQSLPFQRQADGQAVAQARLEAAVVYRLGYGADTTDELYALTVRPDQAPRVKLQAPEAFREFYWGEGLLQALRAVAEDDYGLSRAELVLTRSIGNGEGVTFTQTVIALLLQPIRRDAGRIQQARLTHRLDLQRLGLVPGAELYGRLQVWDNRTPSPQASASETFLLVVADTAGEVLADDFGLQVQVKPAYFRSQRQIILDIEQLRADSATLERQAFFTRSNNIAVDQKLLRLRYGQFLGEEFESAIHGTGVVIPTPKADSAHDHADHDHADHAGHDHAGHEQDGHAHASAASEQPVAFGQSMDLSAFVHAHDTEEGATFFPEAVKLQLKAALAAMWDSELHLRLGQPARALPPAYRALRLLKDVQQKSRVYVRRLGFSLPPLQPDRRLTGDLSKVADRRLDPPARPAPQTQVDAQAAWQWLLTRQPGPLRPAERAVLSRLSPLLTAQLAERPAAAVTALRILSTWLARPDCSPCAAGLVDALAPLLPPPPPGPVQVPTARQDPWAKAFQTYIRPS